MENKKNLSLFECVVVNETNKTGLEQRQDAIASEN